MEIVLANGAVMTPIIVTGETRMVQGAHRDTLSFVFPANEGMDNLDKAFSPENCEKITIVGDDKTENIYHGYTIRAELKKAHVMVFPATFESDEVTEERITVSMAQRTYAESQIVSLTDTVDVLVMESLMS